MIYVLKLWLCDIEPLIWRRLEVPAAITLPKLHRVIQLSLNWEDYHLHQFRIGNHLYEIPDPEEVYPSKAREERRAKLAQVVDKVGTEFGYLYDFGDNWEHRLLLEGILLSQPDTIYPQCTDGARNGPPEDAGGPFGYQDYLEALADPSHEQHEEMLAWRGHLIRSDSTSERSVENSPASSSLGEAASRPARLDHFQSFPRCNIGEWMISNNESVQQALV